MRKSVFPPIAVFHPWQHAAAPHCIDGGRRSIVMKMRIGLLAVLAAVMVAGAPVWAQQKPNILVIMGDDVGWFNIGAYHRGMMSGKTPSLDRLATEGMMFTDYYAEASYGGQ